MVIEREPSKFQAFAARLNQALDLRKYPAFGHGRIGYVQEVFGISRAGANKWLHGKAIPHKNKRIQLAEELGINLNWLETGKGDPLDLDTSIFEASSKVSEIPLLSMVEAYDLEKTLNNKNYSTIAIGNMKKNLFSVKLIGNSMFPRFSDESILIVDPEKEFKDGDYVLAKTPLIPEAIFRQYMVGSSGGYLIAINTKFEPVQINESVKIIGKVIEIRTSL